MKELSKGLKDLQGFLKAKGIPYMVIGGIGNLVWGEPRTTLDIDVTVSIPEEELKGFIDEVRGDFKVLVEDPEGFVEKTKVLPVETANAVRVDIILAGLDYEREAIRRAVDVELGGVEVRVCTPEDLIIHKAISERERDWQDIEGVILRTGDELDLDYLLPRLEEFSAALDSEILDRFKGLYEALK